MTAFLSIENALKEISGEDKKYNQTAGSFDVVLRNPNLTPEEKAQKIAALINDGNEADL